MTSEQEDVVDLLEKRELHSEMPPDGLASIESRARSEILRLRSRVQELEAAMKRNASEIDDIASRLVMSNKIRSDQLHLIASNMQFYALSPVKSETER